MLRKIRSLVSNSDYFGIYDNALSKQECEILINQFEKSPQQPGKVYLSGDTSASPHHDHKKSTELIDTNFSDGSIISRIAQEQLFKCIEKYKKEQPQLTYTGRWKYVDAYNFQKYDGEDEGYKTWHCEHGPAIGCTQRVMAWMFYLNDAKSGTEFMNYPTIQAKRGRCAIWPAFWTHMHKGVTPNKGLKYIATGWVSYLNDGDNIL